MATDPYVTVSFNYDLQLNYDLYDYYDWYESTSLSYVVFAG